MKLLSILIILLLSALGAFAQIEEVQYGVKYNKKTSLHDVYLLIKKGSTKVTTDRAQFSAQMSFVIPHGSEITIAKAYMPLENNAKHDGTIPNNWVMHSRVKGPKCDPKHDYVGIGPTLMPFSYYHDLKQGDIVLLYSIGVKGKSKKDAKKLRLFDNTTDPKSNADGMVGADFTNSIAIGRNKELYVSNAKKF
jgi:hypothetical protein